MCDGKNEEIEQYDMGSNIYFVAVIPTTKDNFFRHIMIGFVDILEFNDHKYPTNGTLIWDNYKGKFLFTMKVPVSFGKYFQSVFYMSNILFKNNIDGVHFPQFQLSYIHETDHNSHKKLVK